MENTTQRRFNHVDEAWIPVTGDGRVSLMRIFSDPGLKLWEYPVEKMLLKLLLAIVRSAYPKMKWNGLLWGTRVAEKPLIILMKKRTFLALGDKHFKMRVFRG
jgi:CRISPR system Cascade subunit CasA